MPVRMDWWSCSASDCSARGRVLHSVRSRSAAKCAKLAIVGEGVYVGGRTENKRPLAEKVAIIGVCENFIAEVLRPRFLPQVRPTEFNYPVAIYGKWHGNKHRFITRW